MAQMLLEAPYPAGTLLGIAQRLIDARGSLDAPVTEGHLVTTADGRQWRIDPRRFDMGWVLACHLPGALLAAGLSLRRLHSLLGLPRFMPDDADRKSVVWGQRVSVRVDLGCRRHIQKKKIKNSS